MSKQVKFNTHDEDTDVINFYQSMPKKYQEKQKSYKNYSKYHIKIPNRIAIVGSSGSGKSNILLNLIIGMNCFTKIVMMVKTPNEPLYKFLIDEIRDIEKKLEIDMLMVSSDLEDLPNVDDFDESENNLVIFDDMISESSSKLTKVKEFWVRGRKSGITTIFLSQSFFKIPQLVRQNTDVIIFKKIGTKRDLSMILSEYSLDKDIDELKAMYKACNTSKITNFFMIDISSVNEPEYMFRKNFRGFKYLIENDR